MIPRLNEALDSAWSFEVVDHEIREEEALVIGRLSAEGITTVAFGRLPPGSRQAQHRRP